MTHLLCREVELRGFTTPVSAAYKGAKPLGRAVEGNPEWVDLSRRSQNKADDEQARDESEDQDEVDGERARRDEDGGPGGAGGSSGGHDKPRQGPNRGDAGDSNKAGKRTGSDASQPGGSKAAVPNNSAGDKNPTAGRNDNKGTGKGNANKDNGKGKGSDKGPGRGKPSSRDGDDYSDIND
jgi:hypothetical protein